MIHHDRVYKRICKEIESKEKNEEKKKARLEQCKATYDERVEACNRNKFPTWEELDTVEDPEKVWYNRMMKASRAYNLDIDWDFEWPVLNKNYRFRFANEHVSYDDLILFLDSISKLSFS